MTRLDGWKVLNAGRGSDLVLAVDFATTGRSDSSFSDLVPLLDPRLTVWETRQPDTGAGMSAADYVELWAREAESSGRTVRAVLGYCAGAVFAGELAARLADRPGQDPRLVVFDPETPDPAGLDRDFAAMMDQFASVLSADEVAAARQAATAARAGAPDFAAFGDALVAIFREQAGAAFRREGLDEDLLGEFAAVFRSFVSYLDAARQIDPTGAWRTAVAVNSRQHTEGALLAARSVDLPVDHVDLLRSRLTADAVGEAVGSLASP
ncbi:hypothetical protein AMK21_14320 [Streptomyces sp. CB00316]|uniref:hypothetical protein n=1 Tax=unclassified Streptomyces TaxID=2593676 RepID=UPI00093D7C8E|nr:MULTISPECIES: hypothetical protein [unclassified Streptomyces]MBT2380624.1 hypothetical protein [Streptomyces sp. ISL-111]MBT2430515.1 hypothetical protein [Streptomyces sp. ISL-112]MBT2461818.1 hypothetical protein [Streptomyces sp. ISL-63]OKJ19549.1 hypothetical protein AMK21_14320 [Streptomyces sp. CB00316]